MTLLERARQRFPQFGDSVRVSGRVATVDLGDPGRIVLLGCETCLEGLRPGQKEFPDGKKPLPITAISADAVDHPLKDLLFVCPACGRLSRFED